MTLEFKTATEDQVEFALDLIGDDEVPADDVLTAYDSVGYGHWHAFSTDRETIEDAYEDRVARYHPAGYGMVTKRLFKHNGTTVYHLKQSRTCR